MTSTVSQPRFTIPRKFTAFLNIEPGEERLIGLLVLLYFSLAFGVVFVQSMAFGVFIAEYGVQGLPYSYISIAFLASLAAMVYIRISGRVAFSRLLFINLVFLGIASLMIWLALNSPLYHAATFILPVWFQVAINLANLAVWPLAGRLFAFRQGKRLFPLLGAGNWLANIIGGMFIPALVGWIGAVHLLILAAASFGLSLLVLRVITRSYLQSPPEAATHPQRAVRPTHKQTGIFNDRYVILIMAYIALWWAGFYFIDNIFYDRAFAQFPDASQLTAFIGRLLSITGIVALISSTMLTSRLISRFGLRLSLLAMPLIVTVSLGILAVSGGLGAPLFIIFAVGSFAKLVNVAFGFSLSQSANALVYQSLPDTTRGRIQATAEGIVQPIAIGLAGFSLLVLTSGLKFNYIGLAYTFIVLGIAWMIIILLLSGNYVQALTRVITKRRLGENVNALADPAGISILKDRLHDRHAGIAIYAMNKLEALDAQALKPELPGLIRHTAPEVRREAFFRVESLKLRSALRDVKDQLTMEKNPWVKESALRALGAVTDNPSELIDTLAGNEIPTLRGSLIGLLKYRNEPAAEQRLIGLLASTSNTDRNLAFEVIGELNQRKYYPRLLSACDSPATSRAAGRALIAIGAEALPEIEAAWGEKDAPQARLLTLAKVLGHVGGDRALQLLVSRMTTPEDSIRSHILKALSHGRYHARDISVIHHAIRSEAETAAWASAVQADLGVTDETRLLIAALDQFLLDARSRVLSLVSFIINRDSVRLVREALEADSPAQVSYALEIMDAQLPTEWKKLVMPLLENLSPEERNRRFSTIFPQSQQTPAFRLSEIKDRKSLPYWLRACAVYTSKEGEDAMLSTVEKVLILKSVPLFSQTPENVLADMADLLEEVDADENESIFKQGDPGDSLYVIVDGKVRVHEVDKTLNYLGERDVFGEMALLDPEPRSATVTAMEATRLFRLDQIQFYDLLEERPEIASGIIRILTKRLRNRVGDIDQLNARLKELENRRPA